MDNSAVILVGLDGLFGVQIPDMHELIVAGNDIGGSWRELAIPHPILMTFEGKLQPSIDRRPHLHQLIVSTGSQQQTITRKGHRSNPGTVRFDESDLFGLGIKLHLPELD